jgi:hypothetical protein
VTFNSFSLQHPMNPESVEPSLLDYTLQKPGDSDVIIQVDRLSSNETKIAPRSVRIAVSAWGRSGTTCMGHLQSGWLLDLTLSSVGRYPLPHGIFNRRYDMAAMIPRLTWAAFTYQTLPHL